MKQLLSDIFEYATWFAFFGTILLAVILSGALVGLVGSWLYRMVAS